PEYHFGTPNRSAAASARAGERSHTAATSTSLSCASALKCSRAIAPQPIRTLVSFVIGEGQWRAWSALVSVQYPQGTSGTFGQLYSMRRRPLLPPAAPAWPDLHRAPFR